MGQDATNQEREISEFPIHQCSSTSQLDLFFEEHLKRREVIRQFYHSNSSAKRTRRLELSKEQYYDRLAAEERSFCKGSSNPMMFFEDRGHEFGSTIKGHHRFGGHWKEKRNGRYTPVLITNEHNSPQTCVWCFEKLSHPYSIIDGKVKAIKGTFVCLNGNSVKNNILLSRDRLSAFAIGLADAAQLLLGRKFPCFDPKKNKGKLRKFP